jgi:hypothetical protein
MGELLQQYFSAVAPVRLNYFNNTFQRMNNIFLSHQISISIIISQSSAKRTGTTNFGSSFISKIEAKEPFG